MKDASKTPNIQCIYLPDNRKLSVILTFNKIKICLKEY